MLTAPATDQDKAGLAALMGSGRVAAGAAWGAVTGSGPVRPPVWAGRRGRPQDRAAGVDPRRRPGQRVKPVPMTMSCSGSDFPDPACLSRPSGDVRAYPGCAAPPNSGAAWCLHHRQEAPAPPGLIFGDAVMHAATAAHPSFLSTRRRADHRLLHPRRCARARDLQRDRNRPHSPPAGSRRLPARRAHLRLPDSAHSLQRLPGRCGPHRGPGDQHPQPAHRQPRARARAGAGERSGMNQGPDGPAHRRARPALPFDPAGGYRPGEPVFVRQQTCRTPRPVTGPARQLSKPG